MTGLDLLAAVNRARLVAAIVTRETGAVLEDDECFDALAQAEASLDRYDAAHGFARPWTSMDPGPAEQRRREVEQPGRSYGGNSQAVRT